MIEMKRYFNMMFYLIYKLEYKFHVLFRKINPAVLIHKLVSSKDKHEKYIKTLDEAMGNSKDGVSSIIAGGFLYGLYFLVFFSIFIFFTGIFKVNFSLTILHGFLIAVPSFVLLYYMVFKDDLYLSYFKEFEKTPKSKMRKLSFLYFLNVLLILLLVILSFIFMSYRNY